MSRIAFLEPEHAREVRAKNCPDHDFCGLTVADFPRSEYDLTHVKRAGDVIAGDRKWTPESEAEIREAFRSQTTGGKHTPIP